MVTVGRTRPAPGWLQDLAAARARYQELLGWPVRLGVTTHPDGPGDSDSEAWWVQPPRPHRPLPPWPAVLGATRRVAARLAERI